ncbi:hypothetical protein K505DRAFT_340857 [Melanomma pulvis-pyrius CBS 109.77]|uniref:Mid2 domain-containing protein n=1 Tax=Melanomma pulvis-pyrius CBS 109.77 TaxID=1314802 RepID=A0A6A6X0B7_9PLEO|nr:hypothetical protein K505DRAFT_340857 [Melanomma pulvis-pyrius CBS 109.77]
MYGEHVREVPIANVVVTQVFAPTYIATTDQAAARPNQTPLPSGYNALTKLHPKTSKPIFSGLSKGAKIGIIMAAISAIIALIGLVAFFFFRRGQNRKYNQIGGTHVGKNNGHAEQHIPLVAQQQQHHMQVPEAPYQPSPLPMHASPAPSYTAPVYEPMRNEPPQEYYAEYKHPYTIAPPAALPFYYNPVTGSGTDRGEANIAELPSAEAYK